MCKASYSLERRYRGIVYIPSSIITTSTFYSSIQHPKTPRATVIAPIRWDGPMGFAHPCLLRQLSFLDAGFPPSPTSLPSPPPPSSQDLSLREKTALHDIGRIHHFFHSSAIAARTLWKDHTRKAYQSSLSSLIVSYKQSPNPKFKPKPTCDTESRHIPNRYRRMRHSCLCSYV